MTARDLIARVALLTTVSPPPLQAHSPQLINPSDARPQYHVVRQLHEASPHAAVYLCETRNVDGPGAEATLVVVKVGQNSRVCDVATTSQRRTGVRSSPSPTPRHFLTGVDSYDQEFAVATRLLEDDSPHPHIVHFQSVAAANAEDNKDDTAGSGDLVVLVMEYCPRGDLFMLHEQQPDRRFAEAQALLIFRQIVSGVHHLHGLGIAHRDISLENVLLDDQGNAKICDFGLSLFVEVGRRTSTSVGVVGKLLYMAPEVAAGDAYDPVLADVWSLGIVLFMLLTGSPLFQVARPSDVAWNAVHKVGVRGILRHWKLEDAVSPSTVDLLANMLRVDSSKRLQSLDLALDALPSVARM